MGQTDVDISQVKPKIGAKQSLREVVDDELKKVGDGGPWVW